MTVLGYLVAVVLFALGLGSLAWNTLHQTSMLDGINLLLLMQVAIAFVGAIAVAIFTLTLEKVRGDNQTSDEWLEAANDPSAMGTGVFLLKAGGTKAYAVGISYDDLLVRDKKEKFYAFAWVPHGVATFQQVQQTACAGRCNKACKRPGCLCDRSIGRCK
jgi:hypothetical protein